MIWLWSVFYCHPHDFPSIPGPIFGEFVTAMQSGQIRGCMGWWSGDQTLVNPRDIAHHFYESLHAALYTDQRSRTFRKTDFYADVSSSLHLQVLLLPLGRVRSNFSNKRQGILLIEQNGPRRATFLPNVFPALPVAEIIPRLCEKAGSPDSYNLYSYKTVGMEWSIPNTIRQSQTFLRTICRDIVSGIDRLLLAHRHFPYLLDSRSRQWSEDDSQHVRNLSCLHLLHRYSGKRHRVADTYMGRIGNLSPHALIYVRPEDVNYDELDEEFGKPQYLLVTKRRPQKIAVPWSLIQKSIFGWNWWTQVISMYRADRYYPRLVDIMTTFSPSETNEWAVLFEGAAVLYSVSRSLIVQSMCIRSFQELGRRRAPPPFYAFLNGDCRLDITCHVLNGLLHIC